jgi:hypothetical protein
VRKLRLASTLALGEKQRIENAQKMGEATEKALTAIRGMVKKSRAELLRKIGPGASASDGVAERILKHYAKEDAARITRAKPKSPGKKKP